MTKSVLTIAACASNPMIMFAVGADGNGTNMTGVWSSGDGGVTWNLVNSPPGSGVHGDYNNAVAVAPDCHAVAVGWQAGSWNQVSLPPSPGVQGDSNQAVAISPDCSTVAVGWQTGTFVSFTGGPSWNPLTEPGEYNDLHTDIHTLTCPVKLWRTL